MRLWHVSLIFLIVSIVLSVIIFTGKFIGDTEYVINILQFTTGSISVAIYVTGYLNNTLNRKLFS